MRRVHLTGKEYAMLELLSLRKGTTLTKEMFLNHLYGGMDEPELKIIDVFICKLRKKLQLGLRRRQLHRDGLGPRLRAARSAGGRRDAGRLTVPIATRRVRGRPDRAIGAAFFVALEADRKFVDLRKNTFSYTNLFGYLIRLLLRWSLAMDPTDLIDELIAREGGYVANPADKGGPTCFGITQAVARAHGYAGRDGAAAARHRDRDLPRRLLDNARPRSGRRAGAAGRGRAVRHRRQHGRRHRGGLPAPRAQRAQPRRRGLSRHPRRRARSMLPRSPR